EWGASAARGVGAWVCGTGGGVGGAACAVTLGWFTVSGVSRELLLFIDPDDGGAGGRVGCVECTGGCEPQVRLP
ncbi:hypothetical protein T484DRAFT_1892354, partial [Baffinella frigidus]